MQTRGGETEKKLTRAGEGQGREVPAPRRGRDADAGLGGLFFLFVRFFFFLLFFLFVCFFRPPTVSVKALISLFFLPSLLGVFFTNLFLSFIIRASVLLYPGVSF